MTLLEFKNITFNTTSEFLCSDRDFYMILEQPTWCTLRKQIKEKMLLWKNLGFGP